VWMKTYALQVRSEGVAIQEGSTARVCSIAVSCKTNTTCVLQQFSNCSRVLAKA
jgi:hypothetical protein